MRSTQKPAKPGEFLAREAKKVMVRVQRGDKANYVEDGSDSDVPDMALLRWNWMELRKSDEKIIDDSVQLPFRSRAEQLK